MLSVREMQESLYEQQLRNEPRHSRNCCITDSQVLCQNISMQNLPQKINQKTNNVIHALPNVWKHAEDSDEDEF